jgi:hypothetical protein
MEGPRRAFYDLLILSLDTEERASLEYLAKAVAIEEEKEYLVPDLERGDPDARARWEELDRETNPRQSLQHKTLERLEARGYLVDAGSPSTAQFMAKSFADWLMEYFGIGRRGG